MFQGGVHVFSLLGSLSYVEQSVCVYIHKARVVNCVLQCHPVHPVLKILLHEVQACSPFPYLSRSRGIQSFLLFLLSCSCSLGRLLSDGRLEPPCCLASSRNLSKPNGSSSNWTGPSLPLPLVLRSELENSLSGTNLQEKMIISWLSP